MKYVNNIHKFYLSSNHPIIIERKDIPKLINNYYEYVGKDRSLTSCEIGVQSGSFSKQILQQFPLVDKHILVDCWKNQPAEIYNDAANKNDIEQENIFKHCLKNLEEFEQKLIIKREYSSQACLYIDDKCLDFLYIDGNHSYDAVKKDLNDWYPKMKHNSIISGHDYVSTAIFGVIRAVDEFCSNNNLLLHLTQNPKENVSWFIFL